MHHTVLIRVVLILSRILDRNEEALHIWLSLHIQSARDEMNRDIEPKYAIWERKCETKENFLDELLKQTITMMSSRRCRFITVKCVGRRIFLYGGVCVCVFVSIGVCELYMCRFNLVDSVAAIWQTICIVVTAATKQNKTLWMQSMVTCMSLTYQIPSVYCIRFVVWPFSVLFYLMRHATRQIKYKHRTFRIC